MHIFCIRITSLCFQISLIATCQKYYPYKAIPACNDSREKSWLPRESVLKCTWTWVWILFSIAMQLMMLEMRIHSWDKGCRTGFILNICHNFWKSRKHFQYWNRKIFDFCKVFLVNHGFKIRFLKKNCQKKYFHRFFLEIF